MALGNEGYGGMKNVASVIPSLGALGAFGSSDGSPCINVKLPVSSMMNLSWRAR